MQVLCLQKWRNDYIGGIQNSWELWNLAKYASRLPLCPEVLRYILNPKFGNNEYNFWEYKTFKKMEVFFGQAI